MLFSLAFSKLLTDMDEWADLSDIDDDDDMDDEEEEKPKDGEHN